MPDFGDIQKRMDAALRKFAKGIQPAQKSMYDSLMEEVQRLNITGSGNIANTVKNISIIASIKNKINRVILTPEYREQVKEFMNSFNEITKLQNEYWKSVESHFEPKPLLKAIRQQTISDTVQRLTENGVGANVGDRITELLRTNITSGGSYKDLTAQLREGLLDTNQKGYLDRYAKLVTVDALNQYNAQYTQAVSNDLGYEWYRYDNSEIDTSRPFCQAMVENNRYFHISQVPNLLQAKDAAGNRLQYKPNVGKDKSIRDVPINDKTGLPDGFYPATNAANFFVLRGGYNCGHQIRPVNVRSVPKDVQDKVYATPEYHAWALANNKTTKEQTPKKKVPTPPAEKVVNTPGKPQPAGTPVSSHFTKIDDTIKAKVNRAMKAIDEVHGDGVLKNIPILSLRHDDAADGYFTRGAEGGPPKKISIKAGGVTPELTHVHEMGHYLDYWALGKQGSFASTETKAGKTLLAAIKQTPTTKALLEGIKSGKILSEGRMMFANQRSKEYMEYLARDREIFARAYSQYIANKSSSDILKKQLAGLIKDQGNDTMRQHWSEEEFKPIEKLFEEIFIEKGWINR